MRLDREILRHRHELLSVAYAASLSFACLLRGAVDGGVISLLLLCYIPLLLIAAEKLSDTHPHLRQWCLLCLGAFAAVLALQYLTSSPESDRYWTAITDATGVVPHHTITLDKAAWIDGVARLVWLAAVAAIALVIGTSESCARLFFQALLVSGTLCIALTFFSTTEEGVAAYRSHAYGHGFVNSNNAAAYLGLMLIIGLGEAARFFRIPTKISHRRYIAELLDSINSFMILKGGFLVFALLLSFAGLLMTGSRAGIALALLCSLILMVLIIGKINLHSHTRRALMGLCGLVLLLLWIWCFFNFGHILSQKIHTNGLDSNTRFDIYRAVLPMLGDRPLLGGGLGSFSSLFQQYRPDTISPDGLIDKAHNSYLEFASEMGLPCLLLLLVALARIGALLVHGIHTRTERYINPMLGFCAWLLAALFSLIDFPLQVPSLLALFLAMTLVGASQTERRFSDPSTHAHPKTRRVRIRKRKKNIGEIV